MKRFPQPAETFLRQELEILCNTSTVESQVKMQNRILSVSDIITFGSWP